MLKELNNTELLAINGGENECYNAGKAMRLFCEILILRFW